MTVEIEVAVDLDPFKGHPTCTYPWAALTLTVTRHVKEELHDGVNQFVEYRIDAADLMTSPPEDAGDEPGWDIMPEWMLKAVRAHNPSDELDEAVLEIYERQIAEGGA